MQFEFITYEDVSKKDPIRAFAFKEGIPKDFIEEIYRLAETDIRFNSSKEETAYVRLSNYLKTFWKIDIIPRRLQYIHLVLKRHNDVLFKLERGGKMPGTYRTVILRGAESKNIRRKDKIYE